MPGKEKSADEKEQPYKSLPLPISSAQASAYHHMQPPLPDIGRSVQGEQSLLYGSQAADPEADLSDRPLDFAPRYNNDHERQMQSNYAAHHEPLGRGIDPIAMSSSFNSWTPPVAPDAVYPHVLPPRSQHDPMSAPSPVSGHTPSFPRFPGPSFQPHIPSATAPFGLGVGTQLHPAAAFPGDMYGAVSERPKKGPVPNWLKEEILRNKAIAKSSLEHPKKETNSIEDEAVDKSLAKNDQADSKSIDSSRSTEEEDDDEDYVEAARTAAINQEIKRVLTEVLLKVTDELFSEIATNVVNKDDSIVEVDHNTVASNHKVSPSSSLVPTPKASARVLVPGKAKESDTAEEKSSSSSPDNVLGLANYASDDEDVHDETQSSRMPNSRSTDAVVQSSSKKLSQDSDVTDNGNLQAVLDEHKGAVKNFGSDMKSNNRSDTTDDSADRNYEKSFSSKVVSGYRSNINSGKLQDGNNGSKMNDTLVERVTKKSDSELPGESAGKRSTKPESQSRETRVKSDKNDRHESRKSSFSKDPGSGRELEVIKSRGEQKGDENYMREDERLIKQKIEDRSGSKEREKEPKSAEKAKESDSIKRSSHHDTKNDKKDASRSNRAGAKEDVGRKRERTKEEDRSRHKRGSDSSRHKKRRSLSSSSRGRKSKDNSSDHGNESSDETSDSSKRKSRSRKRSSPSPVKSRRRQVSRSPHSKHSQHRHSPYSSSETTRGRRSRSRSPVRR
ncbi:ABC transporter B family member 26 [Hibiscus syriacus]|uniref:ABC transporter B family member 26 n=1 Tax=Hibiscus syriacus TaxID=106335 RepID=A0A6A3B619_HIBSY|nr:ABC transporter B family member 26 [Hibiscus syriacus]